jgi:hypothetical protein
MNARGEPLSRDVTIANNTRHDTPTLIEPVGDPLHDSDTSDD